MATLLRMLYTITVGQVIQFAIRISNFVYRTSQKDHLTPLGKVIDLTLIVTKYKKFSDYFVIRNVTKEYSLFQRRYINLI